MVNWDPKAKTTISDEEVIYKEQNSNLYYIDYKLVDSNLKLLLQQLGQKLF